MFADGDDNEICGSFLGLACRAQDAVVLNYSFKEHMVCNMTEPLQES